MAVGKSRAPLSNRVVVVAIAVLVLTVAAIVTDSRRERTGELLVQADARDVLISIRKAGRPVMPPTPRRSIVLPPGDYTVELDPVQAGLRVVPGQVTIAKGERVVVRVEPTR
ncbi:MAG: hypothetical protein NVSMB9_32210 [Isosphaeraceae bacterium]